MASIQQSLNQLLGAAAGVATAGSYMYRQTPRYEASQLEKRADKLMKYELAQTGEKTGEAYEEARKLEVEAAKLHPTEKRVARASEIWEERAEEAAIEERAKAKAEEPKEDPNKRVPLPFATDTGAPEGTLQDVIEASNAPAEPLSLYQQAKQAREELETQKADEAVRNYILKNNRITSQVKQTENYQKALQREKGGMTK